MGNLSEETKVGLMIIATIGLANLIAMIMFLIYAKSPEGKIKVFSQSVILELDKFADGMENSKKRSIAIQRINDFLGWKRLIIPSSLIGLIIDLEVSAIRKMQKATNTPDLHIDEEDKIDDK
jgi:hypothetical protein